MDVKPLFTFGRWVLIAGAGLLLLFGLGMGWILWA